MKSILPRWSNSWVVMILLAGMVLLPGATRVHAAAQVVGDCGDNGGPNQLRAQITAANASGGGTITFTCGPSITLQNGTLPSISSNITIDGGSNIAISGNNASRILVVWSGATLTLNNLTLSHAFSADGDGGAVYNSGTLNVNNSKFLNNATSPSWSGSAIMSLGPLNIVNSEFAYNTGGGGAVKPRSPEGMTTISGSTFHDNESTGSAGGGYGGVMQVFYGPSVTISNSTFISNTAAHGGAIYITPDSTLTMTTSTVSGNTASSGGGIRNDGGTAVLTNVTLSGNSAISGGSIHNSGTATLTNVTLSGSSASEGGGLVNLGTANLTNVTLSDNSADNGGGIFNDGGTLTLTNVTLSGNWANFGGGIQRSTAGTQSLKNVLIAHGKQGANCYNFIGGGSFNLSDDGSCSFGAGRDNIPNLLLGPLANNGGFTPTHLPDANSPAIDSGTGSGCPSTDQRGKPRLLDLGCDVGSVERQPREGLMPLYLPLVVR